MGPDVIDERTEEELEKELKAKKETAEKIKMRQQKYLMEIQQKKEKEAKQQEDDKRKKDSQKKVARD
jgi:tubulin monoglycylase TTLL3/8